MVPAAPETPDPPEQGAPVEKPKRRPGQKKPAAALSDVAALVEDYVPATDSWSKASQNKAYDADLIRSAKMARKTLTQNKDEAGVVEELGGKRAEEIEAWRGWGTIGRGRDKGQMPYRQRDMGPAAARTIGTHRDAVLEAWEKAYGPAARSDLDARIEQRAKDISAQKDVGGQSLDDVTLDFMGLSKLKDALSEVHRVPDPNKVPRVGSIPPPRADVKKDNLLASLFLPSQVQISRQSPEARAVGDLLRKGKSEPKRAGGPFARKLVENRSGNLSEEDAVAVQQAIQGFRDPETLKPEARRLVSIGREYLADVAVRAGAEGMQVKTLKGGKVPFPGPKATYFPRIMPPIKDLKSGATRRRVIENAVFTKKFGTPVEAEKMLDSFIDLVENGGNARNRVFADKMVRDGKADTVEEAIGLMRAHQDFDGPQRFGSAEFAREFDNPFYEPDFNWAITKYSQNMERRIAETRNWGQDNERLDEAIAQIKSESEQRSVRSSANVARGEMQKGDAPIDAAARVMRRFGSYMMSPLSAIRNTGQANNTLLATTFKDAVSGLKAPFTKEGRLTGVESGATSGPVLRDVEAGKGGAPSYQKIIGQTGTEVMLRSHAVGAAKTYLEDMAARIRKNPADKFAAHELKKMGHDPADLASRPSLTREDYLKAGFNISDRTQFGYDELDAPAWFNRTETGKTVSQFRPWVIQQSRLIYDETVGQWQGGTWEGKARAARNVALMATLYPMTGEVLNDVIALIQGKKRTSNLYLRYLENSAQMGVLTVVYDLYNAVQYDNAEGLMMGASASKFKDMATIAGRLAKNKGELSYSDKRLLFRMTPIIGPLFAYRVFPKKEVGASSNASERPTRRAIPKR